MSKFDAYKPSERTTAQGTAQKKDTFQCLAQEANGVTTSSGYGYGRGKRVGPDTSVESLQHSADRFLDGLRSMAPKARMDLGKEWLRSRRTPGPLVSYTPAMERIEQEEHETRYQSRGASQQEHQQPGASQQEHQQPEASQQEHQQPEASQQEHQQPEALDPLKEYFLDHIGITSEEIKKLNVNTINARFEVFQAYKHLLSNATIIKDYKMYSNYTREEASIAYDNIERAFKDEIYGKDVKMRCKRLGFLFAQNE